MMINLKELRRKLHWYGFIGAIRLIVNLICTWLLYRPARLIRLPTYIRSTKKLVFGRNFTSGIGLRIDVLDNGVIHLGSDIQMNDHVHIAVLQSVSIGDSCLIASRVFISDHNHGRFDDNCVDYGADVPPAMRPLHSKPVKIGKNVWLGEAVCILPGVAIGDGSVIGAGSIVTHSIPSFCLAVGNPAKVLRRYDPATREWKKIGG